MVLFCKVCKDGIKERTLTRGPHRLTGWGHGTKQARSFIEFPTQQLFQ